MHDRWHNMLLAQKCSPSQLYLSSYLVAFVWGKLLYINQHQLESSKPAMVKSCFISYFFNGLKKVVRNKRIASVGHASITDHITFLCIQFASLHKLSKPLFSRSVFFKRSFDAVECNIILNKICHLASCWTKSKRTELAYIKHLLLLLLWCQRCFSTRAH